MAEHPAQTVNREFFLSKVEECIRHADEAALPASVAYWLARRSRIVGTLRMTGGGE